MLQTHFIENVLVFVFVSSQLRQVLLATLVDICLMFILTSIVCR